MEFAKRGKELENKISEELQKSLKVYNQSLTFINTQILLGVLQRIPAINLKTNKKRVSGVRIQSLAVKVKPPKRDNIKPDISYGLNNFAKYFPVLLELVELKINTEKLASEIIKTNRQISNLENKLDKIDSDIKYIQDTLQEKQNLEKATLIKIFN